LSVDRDIAFFSADSTPFGQTYGKWTVEWWRWALSIPRSINPVLDPSGKYSYVNQPEKFVWFLAGRFGNEGANFPKRFCKIPTGRSILFPVINYEANFLEQPQLRTQVELIKHVETVEDSIVRKECFVDGMRITAQRVKSDPTVFGLEISKDNPVSIQEAGFTLAAADGYWVFLKHLTEGNHIISFEGSCEQGKLRSGASYQVQITNFTI
jgi:hypothetical protein